MQATTQSPTTQREYYSRHGHFKINVPMPTKEDPQRCKIIEFLPKGRWGHVILNEPELIEAIERRRSNALQRGDKPSILTPAEWEEQNTPAEIQINRLKAKVDELQRKITHSNPLVENLAKTSASKGVAMHVDDATKVVEKQQMSEAEKLQKELESLEVELGTKKRRKQRVGTATTGNTRR